MKGKITVAVIIVVIIVAMILTWVWLQDVVGKMPS